MTKQPHTEQSTRDFRVLRKLAQSMHGWLEAAQVANVTHIPLADVNASLHRLEAAGQVESRESGGGVRSKVKMWRLKP